MIVPAKVLLSCVNSVVSFIGYDLVAQKAFWYCPADRIRACGASYGDGCLLIASDNFLIRMSAAKGVERLRLPGPHENLAHSVHALAGMGIGVADTGNSRVLLYGSDLTGYISFDPLESWGELPPDAIHLNDFVRTPRGLVASCFNYRPYRLPEIPEYRWQDKGYGLLLSLDKIRGKSVGRVVGCGLDCPHSLVWHQERLYCCASATGDFVRFGYSEHGTLCEEARIPITKEYFLRGALPLANGDWLLGGSSVRKQSSKGMGLLLYGADGSVSDLHVAAAGEIYDILPWDDALMRPLARLMNELPPIFDDGENVFPPPCSDFPC